MRVGGVSSLLDLGGAAVGSLLGGVLAGAWDVTTPFWIAAATMTLVAIGAWRPLRSASD